MIKFRLIILGFASTIFMITGCGETQASNNKNVKELTPTSVQKEATRIHNPSFGICFILR